METVLKEGNHKEITKKKRNKIKRRKDNWQLYLMLLPTFLIIAIFNYGPIGGLVMAFQDYKPYLGIKGSEWVGLDHFKFIFEYPHSAKVIWNTFRFGLLKLVLGTSASLIFAILISEVRSKFIRNTTQIMVIFPYFLSWVVLGGIFSEMLHPSGGIINQFINLLGFESISFLGNNNWFVATVVATDVWKGFGFGSIIFLAAMSSIDTTLYEAAEMDGAGRIKQIWHVTLPAMIPIVSIVVAISLATMLHTDFDQIFNLYSPLVYEKGDIIDTFVYRIGLVDGNFGFATAVGVFKSIISLILLVSVFKLTSKLSGHNIV